MRDHLWSTPIVHVHELRAFCDEHSVPSHTLALSSKADAIITASLAQFQRVTWSCGHLSIYTKHTSMYFFISSADKPSLWLGVRPL